MLGKVKEIVEVLDVKGITLVFVEAVLMPNGEFICNGRSIGFKGGITKFFVEKVYV